MYICKIFTAKSLLHNGVDCIATTKFNSVDQPLTKFNHQSQLKSLWYIDNLHEKQTVTYVTYNISQLYMYI